MNQVKRHCGFTSQVNLSCFNDVSVKYWLRIVFLLFVVLYMYLVFYVCLRCINECEQSEIFVNAFFKLSLSIKVLQSII